MKFHTFPSVVRFVALCALTISTNTLCAQDWSQYGNTVVGEAEQNLHGNSIALSSDGQIMAVGAFRNFDQGSESGQVRVYQKSGDDWTQMGSDLNGSAINDEFGRSVALSQNGDTLAVGAWEFFAGGGFVQVFTWDGNVWNQLGSTLFGANDDMTGTSVSLSNDGTTLSVGSPQGGTSSTGAGYVNIYKLENQDWQQLGSTLVGENPGDNFGYGACLSDDGNKIVVGAYANDETGADAGHVRVFALENNDWAQMGADIDGEAAGDNFGALLDCNFDASIIAVGGWRNDGNGSNSGHGRVLQFQDDEWVQLGPDFDGENSGDQLGNSIALNSAGDIMAIGANLNDGNGGSSGHIRMFLYSGETWEQLGMDVDGANAGDECGSSLALSDNGYFVATGSRYNDDAGNQSGHARVFSYPYCQEVYSVDEITSCEPYTWLDNITYVESNSEATFLIEEGSINGCDSIITLNLTILEPAFGVDVQSSCGPYTWIDGVTYDMDNSSATFVYENGSANGCDSLVTLNLVVLSPAYGVDVVEACDSLTWIDGITYFEDNSEATYTFPGGAANGCDSTVTLNLVINITISNVFSSGDEIVSDSFVGEYQWLDCDNGFEPIDGETSQVFVPTETGNYAVQLTLNGCSDVSECIEVIITDVENMTTGILSVYPNPTSGQFTVELPPAQTVWNVRVLSAHGQEVETRSVLVGGRFELDLQQPAGVYFLQFIGADQSSEIIRLIKI